MNAKRSYAPDACDVFRFTKDPNGFFSNFFPAPITVETAAGSIRVPDSETLYQAAKFSDPDHQEKVLSASTPKAAKEAAWSIGKAAVREGWDAKGRVEAMAWCLGLKIGQNRDLALAAFRASKGRDIVEFSARDDFWGAVPSGRSLIGENRLGRMLSGCRDRMLEHPWSPQTWPATVAPPPWLRIFEAEVLVWRREPVTLNAHVTGTDVPGAVYVGRGRAGRDAPFGNPVEVSEENPRGKAVLGYLDHLRENPDLVERIRTEIAGRDVICWCAPRTCHGDIIRHVAAGNPVPETWGPAPKEERQMGMDL